MKQPCNQWILHLMTKATELKTQVCAEIDARRDDIIAIGESILRNPETGFREVKTLSLIHI